ncbi:unnamed protein product [Sphacelaria rigidula]
MPPPQKTMRLLSPGSGLPDSASKTGGGAFSHSGPESLPWGDNAAGFGNCNGSPRKPSGAKPFWLCANGLTDGISSGSSWEGSAIVTTTPASALGLATGNSATTTISNSSRLCGNSAATEDLDDGEFTVIRPALLILQSNQTTMGPVDLHLPQNAGISDDENSINTDCPGNGDLNDDVISVTDETVGYFCEGVSPPGRSLGQYPPPQLPEQSSQLVTSSCPAAFPFDFPLFSGNTPSVSPSQSKTVPDVIRAKKDRASSYITGEQGQRATTDQGIGIGGCHSRRDYRSFTRAMRWVAMTAAIDVTDISVDAGGDPGGRGAAPHNSAALIAADMPRLPGEPSDKQAVEIILRRFCKMYPGVGYNQGYDSACMAIYLAAGHDATATMPVFAKWAACTGVFMFHIAEGEHQTACDKAASYARFILRKRASFVFRWLSRDPIMADGFDIGDAQTLLAMVFLRPLVSLTSRLQFRQELLGDIVDKVLDHGHDGPAVIMWVTCTLMCMAAREDGGKRTKRGEFMSVNRRLDQVSADVQSWSHLEAAACLPLSLFVQGFRDAVGSPV